MPKPPVDRPPSPQIPTLTSSPHQLTRVVRLAEGVEVLVMSIAVMMLVALKVLVSITAVFEMATKQIFFFLERIIIEKVLKIKVHTSSFDFGIGVGSPPRPMPVKMKATENVIIKIIKQLVEVEEIPPVESEGVLLVLVLVLVVVVLVLLSVMSEMLVKSSEELVEVEIGLEALVLGTLLTIQVVLLPFLLIRQHFVGCQGKNKRRNNLVQ